MEYLIDLLINDIKKAKKDSEDAQIPLYIDDDYFDYPELDEQDNSKKEKRVIIIDL